MTQTVSRLLSPLRTGFDPTPDHVGCVADNVAVGQFIFYNFVVSLVSVVPPVLNNPVFHSSLMQYDRTKNNKFTCTASPSISEIFFPTFPLASNELGAGVI